MKQLIQCFKQLKKYKLWTILGIILILFEVLMDLLLPNIMANIINNGIGKQDNNYIIVNVIFMVILTIIGVLGGIGSTYYSAKASGYVSRDLRDNLMKKISSLSFLHLEEIKVGNLITVLTNDITTIGSVIMMTLRILVRVPIIFLGSIIMAVLISSKLSIILIVLLPIMIVFMIIIMKKAFPYFDLTQTATDSVNQVVRENIGGIRVVKANNNELYERKKFEKVNKRLKEVDLKAVYLIISAMPLMMLLINFSIVFILWYGGVGVMNNTFEIGNIMAFIQYLTNILTSVLMGSVMIVMLARSCTSAKRLEHWNQFKEEKETGHFDKEISGKITFNKVSFSYGNGSGDSVLKDIDITITPGSRVGIIGPTGSGKSTFAYLITRNYQATRGEILIDDININQYKSSSLRKQIALAYQIPILFKGTINSNLSLVNENQQEMIKMSKVSQAFEFIDNKGLDYKIEQKGVNLSGGQKQRLALTRTLLQYPKILILDDSTSALDAKTERQVLKQLNNIDSTIILISNKISTIKDCDLILVLDEGEIIASGTHQQLIKTSEFYQMIVETQEKR